MRDEAPAGCAPARTIHRATLFAVALALAFFAASAQAQSLTIYDDALQNGFDGPSYSFGGGFDFNSTVLPHTGTKSVSILGHNFNALSFEHVPAGIVTPLHTADTPILRFWVNGGTAAGQQFHIGLQSNNVLVGSAAALDTYINGGGIGLGVWREVTIDLTQAPFNAVDFDRIDIQSDEDATHTDASATYFDDMVLGQPSAQVTNPLVVQQNDNVIGMLGDRFIWQDSNNKQRQAMLSYNSGQMGPHGGRGGSLRELRYQLPNGATRIAGITTYLGDGDAGFGYVVMHATGSNCLGDDSPIGGFEPGNGFERIFTGRHHAILRFHQNYPRNCDTSGNPTARTVPVTIDWMFSTGHDNPLWAITYDIDQAVPAAVAGTFNDDSRAPYGELNIDGDGFTDLSGVGWGDHYKFTSTLAPVTLNSSWTWNVQNTVPYIKEWLAEPLTVDNKHDAVMGIVQTQTIAQQDAGGGRGGAGSMTNFWNTISAGNACNNPNRVHPFPCANDWPYQANANSLDSAFPNGSNNARITWKTQYGFIGQTSYTTFNGFVATASGWPKKSYSTYIVLGTNSSDPVGAQVLQIETVQSLTFTPAIGSVVTSGPAGNVRADNVTYAPAGYNHVYGALAFNANGNQLDMNIAVAAGTLKKPLIIVGNYTTGADPQLVKFANVTLVADVDYFASVRSSANELWITLNRDLAGPTNRLEITGGGAGLATPTNFVAAATSTSQVTISWTAVAGAANYEIQRSVNNSGFTPLTTIPGTTYNNAGLTANTTYLYKVRAINGGTMSGFSPIDPATTILFTDDPLNAGVTAKAVHVTQLRTAVNAMRAAAGLGAQAFTDPALAAGGSIQAVHLTELRSALDQARAKIGLSALVYVDLAVTPHLTTIKAAHVTGLRNGVK